MAQSKLFDLNAYYIGKLFPYVDLKPLTPIEKFLYPSKMMILHSIKGSYDLDDVVSLLEVAFKCNNEAKNVHPGAYKDFLEYYISPYSKKRNIAEIDNMYADLKNESNIYYDLKALAIRFAMKSLLRSNEENFLFGRGVDDNFEEVVFFQKGVAQVSFHHDATEWMPIFKGEWNGIINSEFPKFEE